ncbi:MAG: CPBP family intramembrane metalloprotease [Clostridiales bacterium]|nr:CPBP family intramembrane metalloprotease [Clostridiales bacterium]
MKKVLKQIGKALGYFAVYFTCMNVADLIAGFVWGYMKGAELKAMGMSSEEAMAAFQSMEPGYKGVSMLIGAILTLLIYFFIEKIKKTSLAKETDMKMVTGKQMGLTVVGALGGMFFLNFMLSILPIPADLLGDLSSGMSSLTSYPFWLALLVNAILIPILEEVVFRGYLFSRLGKAMPAVVAAVISSVVFGLCHGGLVWAIWAGITGLIICVVRVKSGSIIPGIIFHIIMNTYGMVVSYFPVLEKLTNTGMYILTAAGGILLAVYIVGILTDKNSSKEKAEVTIA